MFFCKLPMPLRVCRIDAEYCGLFCLKLLPTLSKRTELSGADGSVITGIENQDHALLAAKIGKANGLLVCIRHGNIGSYFPDGYQVGTVFQQFASQFMVSNVSLITNEARNRFPIR